MVQLEDQDAWRVVRDRSREECKKCGEAQLVAHAVCELARMRGYKARCALNGSSPEERVD
jgi:predicted NAD/FAD-binding protein